MATNFSPCKGSYVLNQFPSNVMFGMKGFHVSASGAIQGHHGPLVYLSKRKRLDTIQMSHNQAKWRLTHSLVHDLKTIPNSKKLQTTTNVAIKGF